MRWRGVSAGLAVCAATMLTAAGAQAATVTIGSNFSAPTDAEVTFGTAATATNFALPAPANAASPVDGTVINWRFSGEGGPATPRIIRPAGGALYTGAGTGSGQVGAGFGNIAGPFTVSIPIKRGDLFGVGFPAGSGVSFVGLSSGASWGFWQPALADGATEAAGQTFTDQEVAIGAVVRYCLVPNLRGKKPKAARQALIAADCAVGKAKNSKKRRKKKKVLSQTVAPGTSISDMAPVGFKVSKLK